jgi:hypothetical protein
MRVHGLDFSGYRAGETDFASLINAVPQASLQELVDVTRIIAGQLSSPIPNLNVSVIVTGHSDRQDRPDLSCDERRASEIAAARDRAASAWEWIKAEVTAAVAEDGVDAGQWWETSPHITWAVVPAATGTLKHDPPSEEQRPENRRVMVLVSIFNPE